MILFFSDKSSARLEYTLRFLMDEVLGVEWKHTDSPAGHEQGFRISYTDNPAAGGVVIRPEGLLFEKGLRKTGEQTKGFLNFRAEAVAPGTFPDIFSVVFYHISRMEEYDAETDRHGRFRYQDSQAFQTGISDTPFLDIWISGFREFLIRDQSMPETAFKKRTYTSRPQFDIDSVFAYRGRTLFRQLGAVTNDLIRLRFHEISMRTGVLLGTKADPNENFEMQQTLLMNKKADYFIQVGAYGKYDKNIPPENKGFRRIVQNLSAHGHRIGLHPSYGSFGNAETLRREMECLTVMSGNEIRISRQHFLRFRLPETYRMLIECGLKEDHSMGWSEIPGFRAGTAENFYWYDLYEEKSTELLIRPFCAMDVAYKNFLALDVQDTLKESQTLMDICKLYRLPFTFVFHNESLSGHRGWAGWEKVFATWCHG